MLMTGISFQLLTGPHFMLKTLEVEHCSDPFDTDRSLTKIGIVGR